MGMSVGVVTIKYLDEPGKSVRDFLFHLASDVSLGFDDDEYEATTHDDEHYTWGGGWGGNTFVEFSWSYLEWRAGRWVDSEDMGAEGKTALEHWIASLPWQDDMVMLHLNV